MFKLKKSKHVIFLIICLSVTLGGCQKRLPLKKTKVEGVVLDYDTGLPVKNAYVFVNRHYLGDYNSGATIARTDENGKFSAAHKIEIPQGIKYDYAKGFISFSVGATAIGYSKISSTSDKEMASREELSYILPGEKNEGIVIKIKKLRKTTFHFMDEPPYDNYDQVDFYCEKRISSQQSYNLGYFGEFSTQLLGLENDTTFVLIDNYYQFSCRFKKNGQFQSVKLIAIEARRDRTINVNY